MINMCKYTSLFWKLYAVLTIAGCIASFFAQPLDSSTLLPTVFSGVGVAGLTGFAFGVPIGPKIFWRIYFGFFVLFVGLLLGFFALSFFNTAVLKGILLLAILLVFCILPLSYSLWAYAYKSSSLWGKDA